MTGPEGVWTGLGTAVLALWVVRDLVDADGEHSEHRRDPHGRHGERERSVPLPPDHDRRSQLRRDGEDLDAPVSVFDVGCTTLPHVPRDSQTESNVDGEVVP